MVNLMQVTEFEGGGTAISLSCPHMLADPTSVTLLINSWAEAYRQDVIVHPPFLHPQALSIPPTFTASSSSSLPFHYASKSTPLKTSPNPQKAMVSATFNFSDSSIKQSLINNCSNFPAATPFDLLTALFWTRIAALKADQTLFLEQPISICTDVRKRWRATPLPYGYFGNALHFSQLRGNGSRDLGQVVELVHQHVAELKEEEFWCGVEWLNSRKDDQGKFLPPFNMYGPELTCVNMVGTDHPPLMYGVEFMKDQKPTHVSYNVENAEGEGLIMVMPSPEEGLARKVTVTLVEEEMKKLLQDEVILSLDPTLLLSGRG